MAIQASRSCVPLTLSSGFEIGNSHLPRAIPLRSRGTGPKDVGARLAMLGDRQGAIPVITRMRLEADIQEHWPDNTPA